ncbi:MAG TPA: tetratricopeptide repeat protein, partial [Pyrinomonadaceae bacterium]
TAAWHIAQAALKLANLYVSWNKLPEAEAAYKRALTQMYQSFGQDNGWTADESYAVGHFYYQQQRYAEAEPLLMRAKNIYGERLGKANRAPGKLSLELLTFMAASPNDSVSGYGTPDVYIKALLDLAAIKAKDGKLDEAEELYEELRSVNEWVRTELPSYDFMTTLEEKEREKETLKYAALYAASLNSYSRLLVRRGKTAEADALRVILANVNEELENYEPPPPWQF